jgi:hypothetical protein
MEMGQRGNEERGLRESNRDFAPFAYLVQDSDMRTSVNIDTDAYDFASAYAHAKGITLGAAISELLRRAEQAPEPKSKSSRLKMNEYGYYEIVDGDPLTSEMVKDLSEDEIE